MFSSSTSIIEDRDLSAHLNILTIRGSVVEELTLGHDSVALALERWKALAAKQHLAQVEEQHAQEVNVLSGEISEARGTFATSVRALNRSILTNYRYSVPARSL
jgi:hypothetical protein